MKERRNTVQKWDEMGFKWEEKKGTTTRYLDQRKFYVIYHRDIYKMVIEKTEEDDN